jgi:DNA-binding XRE family transcriptional regulator
MSVIQDFRIKKNLSVIGLAEHMKVTRQTIYNWENGNVEPSISQVVKLASVLNIKPSTIFKDYVNKYK